MFEGTLPKSAQNTLALLGKSGILDFAYMAGGTALALQIGHRQSVDFDFFTCDDFDEVEIREKLGEVGQYVPD